MNQVQGVEDQQTSIKNNQIKLRDQDLKNIGQVESQVRSVSENQIFTQQEILAKLKGLEDQVLLGDRVRVELRDKLRITEDNNREMVNFIKNLQSQGDQELSSMR